MFCSFFYSAFILKTQQDFCVDLYYRLIITVNMIVSSGLETSNIFNSSTFLCFSVCFFFFLHFGFAVCWFFFSYCFYLLVGDVCVCGASVDLWPKYGFWYCWKGNMFEICTPVDINLHICDANVTWNILDNTLNCKGLQNNACL